MNLKLKILIFSIAFSLILLAIGLSAYWPMNTGAWKFDHIAEVKLKIHQHSAQVHQMSLGLLLTGQDRRFCEETLQPLEEPVTVINQRQDLCRVWGMSECGCTRDSKEE